MQEIEDVNRHKCFAVRILADHWAGVELPPGLLWQAIVIKNQMLEEGAWASE
jgi:hypothetical protein